MQIWKYLHTVPPSIATENATSSISKVLTTQPLVKIPRVQLAQSEDFYQLVQTCAPSVIENLNVGPCISIWTVEYLKEKVGIEREVSMLIFT